ncbi:unnamed protein product [Linum tenue]|uniref:BRF2-like C-terminal domain-containing protein n=1 Tax=Linum tenue TaxID=586396 RepID=A0AAV0MFV3_9ROSI|nr:unnamed protein product [Linum tenue]CAI0444836.1 unnamed protein product [Linum tenue]
MPCFSCGHGSLCRDDTTGSLVCESCGTVQEFRNFEDRAVGPGGVQQGSYVRVGTSGTGGSLAYKEKKVYEANKLIDEIALRLNLSGRSLNEIRSMIDRITEGEYGSGDWFHVLIGACSYVEMRIQNKAFSIGEVSEAVGCDIYELGRMVARVVEHLELRLPEFDIVNAFERVVTNLATLGRVDSDMVGRVRKQGVFLIQCAIKWFLTTGRRPLPVVAAVFVLVAELNGIKDVKLEDVAKDVNASVITARLRYKELLEKLVEVAQALPWGKNVTVKNVVKNAPLVIRYMELKSTNSRGKDIENFETAVFDLGEVISECLRNGITYGAEDDGPGGTDDPQNPTVEDGISIAQMGQADVDNLQLSHECLSMAYEKFLEEDVERSAKVRGDVPSQREQRGIEVYAAEWWNGKSQLSKKLLLEEILEKDVGLETMPPSFVKGSLDIKKRRAKIKAAKLRLKKAGCSFNAADKSDIRNTDLVDVAYSKKKKRKRKEQTIDWEDFIIEALLVHQVKEVEIEKGYYKALLGLHVFNSGINVKDSDVGARLTELECRSNVLSLGPT